MHVFSGIYDELKEKRIDGKNKKKKEKQQLTFVSAIVEIKNIPSVSFYRSSL